MERKKKKYEICGKGQLWKKRTKSGKLYYSGNLIIRNKEGIEQIFHVNVFNNDGKVNDGFAPDCNVFVYPHSSFRSDLL